MENITSGVAETTLAVSGAENPSKDLPSSGPEPDSRRPLSVNLDGILELGTSV